MASFGAVCGVKNTNFLSSMSNGRGERGEGKRLSVRGRAGELEIARKVVVSPLVNATAGAAFARSVKSGSTHLSSRVVKRPATHFLSIAGGKKSVRRSHCVYGPACQSTAAINADGTDLALARRRKHLD